MNHVIISSHKSLHQSSHESLHKSSHESLHESSHESLHVKSLHMHGSLHKSSHESLQEYHIEVCIYVDKSLQLTPQQSLQQRLPKVQHSKLMFTG